MTAAMTTPITGPQIADVKSIASVSFDPFDTLRKPLGFKDAHIRQLRCDPTIALGRAFAVAPGVSSEWSIEADEGVPDDIVAFLRTVLFPMRTDFMEDALGLGNVDFGWVAFEIVWNIDEDGKAVPWLKQLIHDRTTIIVSAQTGEFMGIVQEDPLDATKKVIVPSGQLVLINYRVEGSEWYGHGLLRNVLKTQNAWDDTNDAASRYDAKVAGANWHIQHPHGSSLVNGVLVDNFEIAKDLKASLIASGVIITQKSEMPDNSWDLGLVGDSTPRQTSFVSRLDYLDKQKIRGIQMPERSVLEGQFGTRADASTHGNVALTIQQIAVDRATDMLNIQLVDKIVSANFGLEHVGHVRLKNADLVDVRRQVLQSVFDKMLSSPTVGPALAEAIDVDAVMDELGVPKLDVVVSLEPDGEDDDAAGTEPSVEGEAMGIDDSGDDE